MDKNLLKTIGSGTKDALIKKNIIKYCILNDNSTLTELAKGVDLSIPTVTRFVTEMCNEGYLKDYGKLETAEGRHPNLYGLNADSAYFVGVDIKHFGVNIGMCNFRGDIVSLEMSTPYKFENTQEAFDILCQIIKDFIDRQKVDKNKILNINVNISGRVNPESGYSYSIFYFDEIPLSEKFATNIGYNVTIDNDTRSMTYGEFLAGCVNKEQNVIFVNISWGIALGIIIDGKVYIGKSGFAGEFGHVKTFDNEVLCHCGKKGCLETEISGSYLHRRLIELVREGAVSSLSKRIESGEEITLEDIINDGVRNEDVLCIELIEEIGQKLGEQLAGIINIFNPEMLIIGGILSETGDYLMQPIKSAMRKYSLNLVNRDSKVVLSKFKDKAGVIGACLLARFKTFSPKY